MALRVATPGGLEPPTFSLEGFPRGPTNHHSAGFSRFGVALVLLRRALTLREVRTSQVVQATRTASANAPRALAATGRRQHQTSTIRWCPCAASSIYGTARVGLS